MKAFGLLLLIEIALAGAAYLVCNRRYERAVGLLILASAPLEVYRTSILGSNLSLFRISVLVGLSVVVVHREPRKWLLARILANRALSVAYVGLVVLIGLGIAVGGADNPYARRLGLIITFGLAAAFILATLLRDCDVRSVAGYVCLAALLPVTIGASQGIAAGLDRSLSPPLVQQLPVEAGLSKTRQATSNFAGSGARVKATFGDPNHFGAYLVLPITAALGLLLSCLLRRDRVGVFATGGVLIATGASLISTFSRTGWLAALFGVVVCCVLAYAAGFRIYGGRRAMAAILTGGILLALPLVPTVLDRLIPSSTLNKQSNRGHIETARAAFDAFGDAPIAGIGVGELGVRLKQGPLVSGAHSSYLTTLGEMGLIGLGLLAAAGCLTLSCFIGARAASPSLDSTFTLSSLLAGYVGLLAASTTYDLWWDDFHWTFIGLAVWAAGRVGSQTHDEAIASA